MMSCSFNCTGSFVDFPVMLSVRVMPGEFLIRVLNVKARVVLDLRSMSMFMYYLYTTTREQVGIGFYY